MGTWIGFLIPIRDRSKNMSPHSVLWKTMRPSKQLKFQKRLPLTRTAYPSYHPLFASLTWGGVGGEGVRHGAMQLTQLHVNERRYQITNYANR